MYAIIQKGSKQYRVEEGDVIDIDLLENVNEGDKIEFNEILFAYDGSNAQVGKPNVADFLVHGEVIGTIKGDKITTLKYKPSHTQCRKWGHRQKYTRVKIVGVGKQGQK